MLKELRLTKSNSFEDFSRFLKNGSVVFRFLSVILFLSLKQALKLSKWPPRLPGKQPALVNARPCHLPVALLPPRHPKFLASRSVTAGHVTWSTPPPSALSRRLSAVPRVGTRHAGTTSVLDNTSATSALSTFTEGDSSILPP